MEINLDLEINPKLTFSNLHVLNVSGCSKITDKLLVEIPSNFPRLEVARFSMCMKITDYGVSQLVRCSSLKILDISWCMLVTDSSIKKIGKKFGEKLIGLSLSGCSISDSSLLVLGINCWNIEHLELHSCFGVTDSGIHVLFSNNNSLESLCISGCKLTNKSFSREGIPKLTHLKRMEMSKLHHISPDSIYHLLADARSLTYLDIRGCTLICSDDNLFETIKERYPDLVVIR
eukprot:Anaeramoba_ignava/a352776_18.p1 GENE.a352776_18~~a352776_18.p1  ORF type:complete len:249 (-),score=66.68 a352776_18:23-718(-)